MNQNENNMLTLSSEAISAEVGVLGSMLIDEAAVGPVMMAVSEEDFLTQEAKRVFQAMRTRYTRGEPMDPLLIAADLGDAYRPRLAEYIDQTVSSANAEHYARALKRTSRLYRLRQLGEELSQAEDEDACRALIDRGNLLLCERPGVRRLTMEQGFREFFARHDPKHPPEYVKWGLGGLDQEVHAAGGDMVVIGGYPSAGKTAFALQISFAMARTRRVGFFSYETAADKLHDRTVACQAQLSFRQIMTGKLEEADFQRVYELRSRLTAPGLELIEANGMTVSAISSYAMAHHYDVVLVDYLQKIPAARGGRPANDFERVSQVSSDLQQLGRTTGKVVIALSQLSRAERKRGGDRPSIPTMSSLRQSGQIEQDADVVMLLYKKDPEAPLSQRVLDVAKNKDGESGLHMLLDFDGDKQRFSRANGTYIPPSKREPDPQQSIFQPVSGRWLPSPFDGKEEN